MSKVSPSVSVYLGDELATRVAEAKEAGLFEPKDVCKQALEKALDPAETPADGEPSDEAARVEGFLRQIAQLEEVIGDFQRAWTDILQGLDLNPALTGQEAIDAVLEAIKGLKTDPWGSVAAEAVEGTALTIASQRPDAEFTTSWSDDQEQLTNRLDLVREQGGWPVSVAVDSKDRILLLAAWPTQ